MSAIPPKGDRFRLDEVLQARFELLIRIEGNCPVNWKSENTSAQSSENIGDAKIFHWNLRKVALENFYCVQPPFLLNGLVDLM